jgi:hypothetical protein
MTGWFLLVAQGYAAYAAAGLAGGLLVASTMLQQEQRKYEKELEAERRREER